MRSQFSGPHPCVFFDNLGTICQHHCALLIDNCTACGSYHSPEQQAPQMLDKGHLTIRIHGGLHLFFIHPQQAKCSGFVGQQRNAGFSIIHNKAQPHIAVAIVWTVFCTSPFTQDAAAFCASLNEA
jgi:hypothetical protein